MKNDYAAIKGLFWVYCNKFTVLSSCQVCFNFNSICTYLLSELSGDFLWDKVISIHKNSGYIGIYIRNCFI